MTGSNSVLNQIETLCIVWFTLEYVLRLAVSPNKWLFINNGLNVVDVLAILPFYITLYTDYKKNNDNDTDANMTSTGLSNNLCQTS